MKSPSFQNIARLLYAAPPFAKQTAPATKSHALESSDAESDATLAAPPQPPFEHEDDAAECAWDTFSVLCFLCVTVSLMVVAPVLCFVALLVLPSSLTAPVALVYAAWLILVDAGSPIGRSIMDMSIWNNYRSYFSAQLIKTCDLPPNRNYIMGGHPHGLYCLGLFANILSNQPGFEELFPGVKVTSATLPINFWLPVWREFMLSLGFVSCERNALTAVVRSQKSKKGGASGSGTGRALYIAVGGAEEFLLMEPGTMDLVLLKRKGFAKMALVTGASLVPVLTFGETDYVNRIDTPFTRKLSEYTQWLAHFAFPVFEGRWGTAFPRRAKLITIVGEPLHTKMIENPTHEEVNELHAKYLESLSSLYEKHKHEHFEHRIRELAFVK
ncbi:2-acylglycerol O-acyltransferase 1 [Podochytrium sp. JEL0797]|nr:2-acylglycerol O-acyltransferase 1 [Podochytrium sp. JEL0797]